MKSTYCSQVGIRGGGCPALNIYVRSGDLSGLWEHVIQIQG